jgi:hypothetical protein
VGGAELTFRATSPDRARTITFTGRLTGNAIEFARDVEVVSSGALAKDPRDRLSGPGGIDLRCSAFC